VAALLLALPALTVHRSAAADTTTASTITLVGEPGDLVTGGTSYLFRGGPDQVAVQKYGNNAVNVYVTHGGTSFTFLFNEPVSRSFGTGTFVSNQGSPSTGYPHVEVIGLHGCSTGHSTFTVLDLAPDFSRMQIEYALGCTAPDTAFGELSYNEPADADVVLAPTRVTWPDRPIGAADTSVPVTLINTGTDALTVSDASIAGGDGQYSSSGVGQCATIATGQSCALGVSYVPSANGNSSATLVVTDSSARGSHSVPLSGTGYDPNAPPPPTPTPTPAPPARPCTNSTPNPFAPTPPPPPPPTPGIASTLTLIGGPGDFLTQGQSCVWHAGPDRIALNNDTDGVRIDVGVGTIQRRDDFSFQFRPPPGQPLSTGTYFVDAGVRGANSSDLAPGINVGGDGRGCSAGNGDKFTVLDMSADHSRLWIQYQLHCSATGSADFGELRYNEPADDDLVVAPTRLDRPAQPVGATAGRVPVTLFNTGSAALTVSAVTVDGPAVLDFPTGGVGNCASIAAGASCAVDVGFTPTAPGDREATLRIIDSSAAHGHTVPLSGRATTIASVVTMAGDAADPVSAGGADLWRGGTDRLTVSGSTSAVTVEVAHVASLSPDLTLTFGTPYGQTLTAGTTYPLAREPGPSPGQSPAISATTPDITCTSERGQFTVVDVADDLSRLWVLYEAHCNGGGAAAFGEIRYNEPTDADVLIAPSRIAWPLGKTGTPERSVPVSVFNTGTTPLTLSGTDLAGYSTGDFATNRGCAQIAAGDSCVLTAGFTPGAAGPRSALLKLTDASAEGFHTVTLGGLGAFDGPPATMTLNGEPGQTISYQNPSLLWQNGPDRITVSGGGSGVGVFADHGVTGTLLPMGIGFATGDGTPLMAGRTYTGATGTGTQANGYVAGTPMINATINHQTCGRFSGQFTVLDIADDLSRLWITYEVRCAVDSGSVFGEIRYNEPTEADVALAPARVSLPDSGAVGVTVPVTVFNTGAAPLRLTGSSFSGPAAGDFNTDAGCPDPVAAGGSCVLTVTYRPGHPGAEQAVLTIADTSAAGAHRVALGAAVAAPSSVTLVGEHNDPVVGNGDEMFLGGRDLIQSRIDYTGVHLQLGRASGGPDSFIMDFQPVPGQRLTPGQYLGAQTRQISVASNTPGIYVNRYPEPHLTNGTVQCPVDTGRFTVLDMAPDLGRVWLVYQSHCGTGTVFGEVRINESPDPDVAVTPSRIEFPDTARTVPVTVTNVGRTPTLTVRSATLTGPAAADFVVTGIGACASVPVGGGCTLQVSFRPTNNGDRIAALTLADSSAAGTHTVALAGTASGIVPTTTAHPPPAPAKPAPPSVVTSHLSAKGAATRVKHGHPTKIKTTVSPATTHRAVVLQRLSGGHWKTVAHAKTDSHGHATFSVQPKKKGTYTYRAYCAKDTTHTSATSKSVKLIAT
jgi:hypothetical protein